MRSRTTRSSKGKASTISSSFSLSTFILINFYNFFFSLFLLYPSLSYHPILPSRAYPLIPTSLAFNIFASYQLLSDPEGNTQLLTEQLRQLGLYAADTTGDGNCLFRALSDQLFGTESRHHQLRKDICDWIQSHSVRYAPFVDDERGLDVHLSLMRQPGEQPNLFFLLLDFIKRPHTRLFIIFQPHMAAISNSPRSPI